MKRLTRTLLALSFVLMLAGMSTCYFGQRHAVNQIPPEVRAGMSDTDWVGFRMDRAWDVSFLVRVPDWISSAGDRCDKAGESSGS